MKKLITALVVVLPMYAATATHANAPVQGTMTAYVVETEKNKEKLVSAKDVEPNQIVEYQLTYTCLLYTSPSPRDATLSRMPSSA